MDSKKEVQHLVSIIVPVYNVEKYVEECVQNGVFDLEDKLLIGNNVVRSDEALHSFYYCMETLCKNKHYWVGDYNNKIGGEFLEWCNDFINSLMDDKIQDAYWYYQENPNFRIFIRKAMGNMVLLLIIIMPIKWQIQLLIYIMMIRFITLFLKKGKKNVKILIKN